MDGGDFANGHITDSDGITEANGVDETTVIVEKLELGDTTVIIEKLELLSIDGDQVPTELPKKLEKDPRRIARKYQLELCKKALEENIVVYLGTGCGKTHIASLLIYEMGHLIRKPLKNVCIFLAPTVALAQQQAKVIEDSIDFKVGTYCGSSKRLKHHEDWAKEMQEYEVLVMTPMTLLHNLSHCFIKMEFIALLIFDECHYAQPESDHPYAEIMKVFYKPDAVKLPRIFGMTASPKLSKGTSIDGLESLLRAKVYSVGDKDELEQFAASPKVTIYQYTQAVNGCYTSFSRELEELKHQCLLNLPRSNLDHGALQSTKKMLQKLHGNIMFCLENLGLCGALQACHILLKGDHYETTESAELEEDCAEKSLCNRYLTDAESSLVSGCKKDGYASDLSEVNVPEEPFFSTKLLCLIGILRNFRLQLNMKCIIFVNRVVTAISLSHVLRNLKILSSWKCDFLVGVHSGLKSMSRKNTNNILEKFRSGELNLLIATKVGEEGLDIQTCCLVIRFDLPETVASFIQSRGRARMQQSEYAFLINRDSESEINLIKQFMKDEAQMDDEISSRESQAKFVDFDEKIYNVDGTGASVSATSSVSLLHHYCSKLPHDEYFNPKPQFSYFDDVEGKVCKITLPPNAPIRQIFSEPQASIEISKKDACLKACKMLHEIGALTDYLLPEEDLSNDPLIDDFSDYDESDDEDPQRELHEMLVPAILKLPLIGSEHSGSLNCYYFYFCAKPEDRVYRKFALFLKSALPKEAERMKLDLHLARGRHVFTELIPSGVVDFDENQLVQAEKFQSMSLKAILDRSEFIPEFVSLEKFASDSSPETYYLMLPVVFDERKDISVDWNLVHRCLSSPIFRAPEVAVDDKKNEIQQQLHLANGFKSIEEIVNSLVYVPCKNAFFFISGIFEEKNAYCLFNDSKSHIEHYFVKFNIQLRYPNQALLKAKHVFSMVNLLRKKGYSESHELEEHFIEIPPEICQLKIIGFSKDIGSSLSLLPSIMHRLESLLVAIELKEKLCATFPEASKVSADHFLQALTTEMCQEKFSLERLEVLGDAFLKFAVGRHLFLLHRAIDEGQLTRKRSNIVNNINLFLLATTKNLQVYIRDKTFQPVHFYVLGRHCPVICNAEIESDIHHFRKESMNGVNAEVRCGKQHHWIRKKTIADVLEALVGAFLIDSGFRGATAFLKWIGIRIDFDQSQLIDIYSDSTSYLSLADQIDISALENRLGYVFIHKGLLIQAFVHPSFNKHSAGCYQRLEFLGDAVLDYLITSYLYTVYPKLKPGQLTDSRSAFVGNTPFAIISANCSFHKLILCDSVGLSKSMDNYVSFIQSSGKEYIEDPPICPKALGDLIESSIGAIMLDTGFDLNRVWNIMLSLLKPIMNTSKIQCNSIRDLPELCQSNNFPLEFLSSKKDGMFSVVARVTLKDDTFVDAVTVNNSKKFAKRMSAEKVFTILKGQGYKCKTKSLEQVLRESVKKEAKLIGYDETPYHPTTKLNQTDLNSKLHTTNGKIVEKGHDTFKPIRPLTSAPSAISGLKPIGTSKNMVSNFNEAGEFRGVSAKSLLYEVCAGNYWKPPTFECCLETGLGHMKEFIYKVAVETDDPLLKRIECYGKRMSRKKDAAENAAEGLLFYLKDVGYLDDKRLREGGSNPILID